MAGGNLPNLGKIAIVGCGVVGAFLAYRLSVEGVPVVIVEGQGVAAGASGTSAGNVQPATGDVTPYKIAQGAESLALFRKYLPQIKEESGMELLDQPVRYLYAALDQEEEATARGLTGDLNAAGLSARWLDGRSARELEPRLSPALLGGMLHQDCIQMDPGRFVSALVKAAAARGAEMVESQAAGLRRNDGRVDGVRLSNGNVLGCDAVVLAAGFWSAGLAREWLGIELPVEPVGLQKIHLGIKGPRLACAVRWGGVNIVHRQDEMVHVGSMRDPAGIEVRPTGDGKRWMLGRSEAILPGVEVESVVGYAACAAQTPQREPVVGRLKGSDGLEGVYAAVPSTDGFLLSALLADVMTNLLVRGQGHQILGHTALGEKTA